MIILTCDCTGEQMVCEHTEDHLNETQAGEGLVKENFLQAVTESKICRVSRSVTIAYPLTYVHPAAKNKFSV